MSTTYNLTSLKYCYFTQLSFCLNLKCSKNVSSNLGWKFQRIIKKETSIRKIIPNGAVKVVAFINTLNVRIFFQKQPRFSYNLTVIIPSGALFSFPSCNVLKQFGIFVSRERNRKHCKSILRSAMRVKSKCFFKYS